MPEKRKMEYKTYLFDFDYTLADSSRGIVICFRNVLTRHGHTDITDEGSVVILGGLTFVNFPLCIHLC